MSQKPFVHADTIRKLDTVADYADFYTRALSKTGMKLHYLDAFAGTGQIPLAQELPPMAETLDLETVVRGSALRALEVTRPFDRYVFSDIKRSNIKQLDELKANYPGLESRIFVSKSEANETVLNFCSSLSYSDRALVFLDPFGNQVGWNTLEVIARTKKIDLWYLFPAGLGVVRQVANRGEILNYAEQSLDRMFGNQDWRTECVKFESEPDLFASNRIVAKKIATAEGITRYMIRRMETIFEGGVSDRWLPLGRNGIHQFSLLFACANPGEKARSLAQRVARDIMKRR